jgi:hypothetical protein
VTALARALAPVVEAAEVLPGAIRWFGDAEAVAGGRDALVAALRARLYEDWYQRGAPGPAEARFPPSRPPGGTALAAALVAAREGVRATQRGWSAPDAAGEVRRDGLRVRAAAGDLVPDGPGAVALRLPAALPALVPGYVVLLGARDLDGAVTGRVMRAYLHATPRVAVALARAVCDALDARGVPFRMKLLDDPRAHLRCDAAVVYARMEDTGPVVAALAGLDPALRGALRPAIPPLTLRLAPGVGWAEDPGGLDSFGDHRAGLVAEGLVRAAERGERTPAERILRVARVVAAAGIDPARPHIGPAGGPEPEPWG